MNVIKRDGKTEPFDPEKLKRSIRHAYMDSNDGDQTEKIYGQLNDGLKGKEQVETSELRTAVLEKIDQQAARAWRNFDARYKVR